MTKQSGRILALIIARGGSKSIPRKNIRLLKGKPLIAWSIALAKSVPRIERVIVSTDDAEIAAVARHCGAELPFIRPAELATDVTPSLAVVRHAITYLAEHENYRPDIVLLFFPTAPFLKPARVEQALDLFAQTKCRSVLGVVKDWGRFWKLSAGRPAMFYPPERVNRQYFEPLYRESGDIYFSRTEVLMDLNKSIDEQSVEFLIMEPDENIDIDTPADWARAEQFKLT